MSLMRQLNDVALYTFWDEELGGFAAGSAQDSCDVDVDGAEELMPVALRDTLRGVRFADYVEVDTGASVCGALTDEDIIAQVAGAQPVAAHRLLEPVRREKKQMVITDFFGQ
ncbi:hypothetical protein HPB52_006280 [Rhipicephalus sanguineus]|uniref:Uncharacterized protein n=1 Tax=Rhipicephalus sanguineus TaxID=34632 RepID=A0A9D4T7R4_RHISA|nr:hypothetical protein HPB52_006280 [Rhipicephalus sanguineus]